MPSPRSSSTPPPAPIAGGRLARLAEWSLAHRRLAVGLWVAILVAVSVAAGAAGSDFRNDFSLPGTDSQRAAELLAERGAAGAGDELQIVVADPGGLREPGAKERVTTMLERVAELPIVADVRSPYADGTISPDGTIGYATVALSTPSEQVTADQANDLVVVADTAAGYGTRVEVGGDAVRGIDESGGAAEGAGLMAALIILALLFGSIVAASLPLLTAIFAVGSSIALVGLASHVATVADFTQPVIMLVGLGVGIDYALLVFSRYRSELLAGADRRTATVVAMDAAGRTVLFAGCTVIIALLGLVLLGLGSLQGVAIALAVTVLMTLASSLTLLPALLGIFGRRIERHVVKQAAGRPAGAAEHGRWAAWARGVQRRPWVALVAGTALVVALCLPALDLRLGFADAGSDPASSTSRQAYDLLAKGFGPGANGPLVIVSDGGDANAAEAAQRTLASTPGIARATPPVALPDGDGALIVAVPASAPQSAETQELVRRLRDDVLGPLGHRTGATYLVGGSTAAAVDFSTTVADRMPLFVGAVVGLSILLLLAIFRSLLIPLKAAVLNLLSIGAALGVITLVFQHGLLGTPEGPVEAFLPVMIFAIVFGLSMDYEVFLVSRMHERWERDGDARAAVTEGLATTGRVITAAAAIMIVVFAAFLFSPSRMLQQFGLGLATAILVDAVVIRCLIVPAVMQLLGDRAWWLPKPLARALPRLALERPSR